jgi:hypothetical protein
MLIQRLKIGIERMFLRYTLFLSAASMAWAQLGVEAYGLVGSAGFIDTENHKAAGVALRVPISRGWGFEPEFAYFRENNIHYDLGFSGNFSYRFLRNRRVQPYFIGGIGVLANRTRFFGGTVTGKDLSASAGFGVRVFLNERWFLTPEARIGWEPVARATFGIGYAFGK